MQPKDFADDIPPTCNILSQLSALYTELRRQALGSLCRTGMLTIALSEHFLVNIPHARPDKKALLCQISNSSR